MHRILFLPLALLEICGPATLLAGSAADTARSSSPPAMRALVIAISSYRDGTTVDYAEESAVAFRSMLERLGVPAANINSLFGVNATRENIRNALASFSHAGPDDRLFIYFAGRSFATPDLVNPDGGIVANEYAPVFPKPATATSWGEVGSGISWATFRLLLGQSPAREVIIFSDAPAGGLIAGPIIIDGRQPQCRMIVAAGDRGDSAHWDSITRVSIFVRCVTSGIEELAADADGDGEVTGSEIAEYLASEIPGQSGYRQRVIARSFVPRTAEFHFRRIDDPVPRGAGTLALHGVPKGAVVAVAGRRTTGNDTLVLPAGRHRVVVFGRPGTMESDIQIARDSTTRLDVNLLVLPGSLQVHCRQDSVSVRLDGREVGITPLTAVPVPCGLHTLVLQKEGFVADSSWIFVRPGAAVRIHRWMKKPFLLEVTSAPPGASVKVDEMEVGITPLTLDAVPEGERFLELTMPDFHPFRTVIQGYWPDTLRVAKNMTSMYGLMMFRTPSGTVMGSLDSVPLPLPVPDSARILTGNHTLAFLEPASGASVAGSFVLGPAQRLDAIAEFNFFSATKCLRGLLIPGLNQFTEGQTLTGIGMFLANAGSLAFTLVAQSGLREKRDTYESARADYLAATNERDAIRTRTAMSAAYDNLDRATRTRNIAASCFAGAFVFSAVHTILFHSRASSLTISLSPPIAVKPTVDLGTERAGYGIAISF